MCVPSRGAGGVSGETSDVGDEFVAGVVNVAGEADVREVVRADDVGVDVVSVVVGGAEGVGGAIDEAELRLSARPDGEHGEAGAEANGASTAAAEADATEHVAVMGDDAGGVAAGAGAAGGGAHRWASLSSAASLASVKRTLREAVARVNE